MRPSGNRLDASDASDATIAPNHIALVLRSTGIPFGAMGACRRHGIAILPALLVDSLDRRIQARGTATAVPPRRSQDPSLQLCAQVRCAGEKCSRPPPGPGADRDRYPDRSVGRAVLDSVIEQIAHDLIERAARSGALRPRRPTAASQRLAEGARAAPEALRRQSCRSEVALRTARAAVTVRSSARLQPLATRRLRQSVRVFRGRRPTAARSSAETTFER